MPTLHSASDPQSWIVPAPGFAAHEVSQVDVVGPPAPPPAPTSRQHTLPAPQLAALVHVSAALPLHEPLATHVAEPAPPAPPDTQHSCVPAVHVDAPHAMVAPPGGVVVGIAVGVDVGAEVGAAVALEGGVVVDPLPVPLLPPPPPGAAGSVGLVVVVEELPMVLPSVEPPQATAARMPARDAAKRGASAALRGSEVFIGGTNG